MKEWAAYFLWWCLGLGTASIGFLILRYYELKRLNTFQKITEEYYRKKFEDMIYRINHNGAIPDAASIRGLIKLIILVIERCINLLLDLCARREWNTKSAIEELHGLIHTELKFLEREFEEFNKSVHTILKEYDHLQHEKDENSKNN